MTGLEAGELSFDRGHKRLHRTIEDSEDLPNIDALFRSCQRIASSSALFGFDEPSFAEILEDFFEVDLRA